MKMEGEALIDAGIMPNDILIIDRSLEPKTGNLILVFYNGEYLVRRFKQEGDEITLHADNANAHFEVIKPTPNASSRLKVLSRDLDANTVNALSKDHPSSSYNRVTNNRASSATCLTVRSLQSEGSSKRD